MFTLITIYYHLHPISKSTSYLIFRPLNRALRHNSDLYSLKWPISSIVCKRVSIWLFICISFSFFDRFSPNYKSLSSVLSTGESLFFYTHWLALAFLKDIFNTCEAKLN